MLQKERLVRQRKSNMSPKVKTKLGVKHFPYTKAGKKAAAKAKKAVMKKKKKY